MNPFLLGFGIIGGEFKNYRATNTSSVYPLSDSPAAALPIFEQLASRYLRDTAWMSSADQYRSTRSYKALLGLGTVVIPLVLQRMQDTPTPEHWFPLLSQVTGDDPTQDHHRGVIEQMKNDWLSWGQQRGLL